MASETDVLVLVLGNQLLLAEDPHYPGAQRFRVRRHTIDAVCKVMSRLARPPDAWVRDVPVGVHSALDVFVGYVMLDVWIANQDRHHENWGALWDGETRRLAPTFDHGAALSRNLQDPERAERLKTKDRNRTIAAFAKRGRSALYATPDDAKSLDLLSAFVAVGQRASDAAAAWLDRLAQVSSRDVRAILEKVPAERMTSTCLQFSEELLLTNHRRLLEISRRDLQ